VKFHYLPGGSALAGHIVLEWIGAPYEAVKMSHDGFDSPTYLACNAAAGTVPTLEHGDVALAENVAILGYLAELHPEAGLLGDGSPCGRAEVMRWLGFLDTDVREALLPLFKASLFVEEETQLGVRDYNARQRIRGYLERLDTRLAGRDWLVGTRSVADPYLLVILRWAVGLDMGLYGLDHLMRFARRMEADPGVQAAILAEEGVLA